MLYSRAASDTTSPLRPAGTLLKQSERDQRTGFRVNVTCSELPVVGKANRGSVKARQCSHLRASQVRPTRQLGSELRIRSCDHSVEEAGWQCRVLGQSV